MRLPPLSPPLALPLPSLLGAASKGFVGAFFCASSLMEAAAKEKHVRPLLSGTQAVGVP
jgi:hypothetical protein